MREIIIEKDSKFLVRTDLKLGEIYDGVKANKHHLKHLGKSLTVRHVYPSGNFAVYENASIYTSSMLIAFSNNVSQQITKGDKIIINNNLKKGQRFGKIVINKDAATYAGKTLTIKQQCKHALDCFKVEENKHLYDIDMISKIIKAKPTANKCEYKIEVGDEVTIKYNLKSGEYYNETMANDKMEKQRGNKLIVSKIIDKTSFMTQRSPYIWTHDMVLSVRGEERFEKTIKKIKKIHIDITEYSDGSANFKVLHDNLNRSEEIGILTIYLSKLNQEALKDMTNATE